MRFILLLLTLTQLLFALNFEISNSTIANGKTSFIELIKDENIKYEKIILDKKKYKICEHPLNNKKMYALIPVSYYTKPNSKTLKIFYKEKGSKKESSIAINIVDGKYKKETLKVSNSKVNLNKTDKLRASKEYKEAMDIYNSFTDISYISSNFIHPLDTKITSDFGKARVYNDTLKGYHSGTDFRAKVGVPIKASNDGVVVLAKDRFYSGGSIVIDHGHGIYTCYFHMSKFDVKVGDKVSKAQIIGLSGDSGRVTGPHLHFSARVSGVQVDPLQLITLINKNIFN